MSIMPAFSLHRQLELSQQQSERYHAIWQQLYSTANTHPNSLWLSHMITAHYLGISQLPDQMGLTVEQWQQLWQFHFPHAKKLQLLVTQHSTEKGQLRQQLLDLRLHEWQDVVTLLGANRRGQHPSEIWVAHIVAAACLSNQHLWKDLGLRSRTMLKQLLRYNVPSLVIKNQKDMRWKRFFYKQLCEQEGGYVCRSPSCEQCSTYQECFGHEDEV